MIVSNPSYSQEFKQNPLANTAGVVMSAVHLYDLQKSIMKSSVTDFRIGDTVKVHAKITEGNKERIQVFEGVVIKRNKKNHPTATFTVRKVSYDIGVERTFLVHSPRVEKVEVVARGNVRRSRLFYLRPLRGKAARIKSRLGDYSEAESAELEAPADTALVAE